MMPAPTLRPIRAISYLNDPGSGHVHVCGLGCEAEFAATARPPSGPGYPRQGVALIENLGFTLGQLAALQADIVATYPGLPVRTARPLTEALVRAATERGETTRRDPGIALSARYLPEAERLAVEFRGETRQFDLGVFEELAHASPADLAEVEITPAGSGLHFPRLGIGLSALMLFLDRFERPPED